MADAEASFSTSMETMSWGFTSDRLPASPMGKPSTTSSGALEPRMEELPRTRTTDEAPGSWELLVICTPAMRPCMRLSMELAGTLVMLSVFTEATLPVRSLFFIWP